MYSLIDPPHFLDWIGNNLQSKRSLDEEFCRQAALVPAIYFFPFWYEKLGGPLKKYPVCLIHHVLCWTCMHVMMTLLRRGEDNYDIVEVLLSLRKIRRVRAPGVSDQQWLALWETFASNLDNRFSTKNLEWEKKTRANCSRKVCEIEPRSWEKWLGWRGVTNDYL